MSNDAIIQPIRATRGADDPGPRNLALDLQNPDILIPPNTDNGSLPNLKFPFALAHNRLEDGGWAREVTVREFPASKSMAGVNMRLGPGVVRELHWHKEAEWAYILQGTARLTVVDTDGNVSIQDLVPGDVWLVPTGIPHAIQGMAEGTEFLLVFDDGNFSENETLLVTEFMAHTPPSVLAKNFGIGSEHFANIPKSEKYIFRQPVPQPVDVVLAQLPDHKPPPQDYVLHASKIDPARYSGGTVKTIDCRNFPLTTLSALIIEIEPGAMREIHWHPDADEWQYYIEGEARMTVFDATSKARTFNYRAGDVGFVPRTLGHYIENLGTTPVRVINVFNSRLCTDISLNQWLALTPPDLVRGHLNLDDTAIKALRSTVEAVVR
ncbi:cupin domain-containing protein [Rhizobiaceae bacterium n13]|uniref:Cupin domain-containing protein n=1 Tax=Ferirhizobium litorale TaxID=2927786 RepID=A0AAE3U421_9HYPH|nr:cupin domain-containing protein [Fererhizobium litorale]MDI7865038.1 cupin domain-containing protein [Fererhizobium litorale]MDI7925196.1 cupin domain-containing protein [Fererhizobium litorale]